MSRGGIFVINEIINFFYVTKSKTVPYDRLRMPPSGNFVITWNDDNDDLIDDRLGSLNKIQNLATETRARLKSFNLASQPVSRVSLSVVCVYCACY